MVGSRPLRIPQEHVFPIEDGIGELADPVAENHQTGMACQFDVELDMAVPEDEVVDVGMVLNIVFGKEHKVFLVITHIVDVVRFLVLDIAVLSPCQSETDAPTGMEGGEQPLAYLVMEDGTDHLERSVGVAHAVTMGKEELLTVDLRGLWLLMQDDPTFLLRYSYAQMSWLPVK